MPACEKSESVGLFAPDGYAHQQQGPSAPRPFAMQPLFTFVTPPARCGYLPEQKWQLRYDIVGELTPAEYLQRMKDGWRRFGFSLFRPECPSCRACQVIRVPVDRFRMNTSQKRAKQRNANEIRIEIGEPIVTDEKLQLYDRYHAFQAEAKGWPERDPESPGDYVESFVANPIPTEEWCYYLGDTLVGVGYVDVVPEGLSAIYFYYEPELRDRSLGTFNVISIIESVQARKRPHLYLGFYVEGCRSLAYKANFRPNELRDPDGIWHDFR